MFDAAVQRLDITIIIRVRDGIDYVFTEHVSVVFNRGAAMSLRNAELNSESNKATQIGNPGEAIHW